MSVSGIFTSNLFSARYVGRSKNAVSNGSFAQTVSSVQKSNATFELHMADNEEGTTLGSVAYGGKQAVTVVKPRDFDSSNPVYKVKVWDENGNLTERTVDVSKVNEKNSDRVDMFAYSCYLTDSGQYQEAQDTFMHIDFSARSVGRTGGGNSLGMKMNWVGLARELMQMQYNAGNLTGYLSYKKFADFF